MRGVAAAKTTPITIAAISRRGLFPVDTVRSDITIAATLPVDAATAAIAKNPSMRLHPALKLQTEGDSTSKPLSTASSTTTPTTTAAAAV